MESQEGVRILERLDWSTVLATPTWFPYLRALVRDLESTLGPPAFGIAAGGNEASWQVRPGPLGHDVAFRVFAAEDSQPLQVAVTWATDMGGVATASLAERLSVNSASNLPEST
jgi:hypothetical protein